LSFLEIIVVKLFYSAHLFIRKRFENSHQNCYNEFLGTDGSQLKRKFKVLADFDGSRVNNFTVIRLVLAWAVLYGHSYAIQKTPEIRDPLNYIFQGSTWIGAVAVNGFFVISGFLVTASYLRRGLWDYTLSRCLRIYPALVGCVFVSVFLLGAALTSLSQGDYFSDSQTHSYLLNSVAFLPMKWSLPGVFEGNSLNAINGSMWSLTAEVRCYLLLAVLAFLTLRRNRTVANVSIVLVLIVGVTAYSEIPLLGHKLSWARPATFFLVGVALYINRSWIPISGWLALVFAAVTWFSFGEDFFDWVFPITLSYLLFYLAYGTPYINLDGWLGDISYGVYIYAWPSQQLVAQFMPTAHPLIITLVATLIVLPLAWVSWTWLEKPALGLKKRVLRKNSPPSASS
jgi:peptidoglycan/LPS O-acetylase OafA/YrhL